jgi:hypothetical protein
MYSYIYRQSGVIDYTTKKASLFAIARKWDSVRSRFPEINYLCLSTHFVVLPFVHVALIQTLLLGYWPCVSPQYPTGASS